MLPFRHMRGYTVFPKCRYSNGAWVGFLHIVGPAGTITSHSVHGKFKDAAAAQVAASIDAAELIQFP